MAALRCLTKISQVSRLRSAACLTAGNFQPSSLARMVPVRLMSALSPEFESAKARLGTLSEDPGNEVKLKMYALFKQSTTGAVKTKRPGMMDFVGRAKWDAWNGLSSMSQEDAQKAYVELVDSLVKNDKAETEAHTESGQKFKNLLVTVEDGLRTITLNRPTKMNAITREMYDEWVEALADAAADPKTVITVITGAGKYYCSGNDLSNFTNIDPSNIQQLVKESGVLLQRFVASFIDFPKPLIAVVNGPAVGISVTTMGLFDAVYATDAATFNTPFSALGQSPEGCSSYTFPKIMGYTKANELLLFNKKISAHEACDLGLVTEVIPDASFQKEVWPKLQAYAKLPAKSLIYSKALIRQPETELLHKVNLAECDRLVERWASEDCMTAIMNFFSRKK